MAKLAGSRWRLEILENNFDLGSINSLEPLKGSFAICSFTDPR